jgi:hypothetical protein
MGSRRILALALVLAALGVLPVAHADSVANISLLAPARPVQLVSGDQNILMVHNPSAQALVLSVPSMDFRLSVPAGESRRIMVDPDIARSTGSLTYSVEGVSAAAPLATATVSSPLSISTRPVVVTSQPVLAPSPVVISTVPQPVVSRGIYQPLVTNSINARNEAGQVYAALQPTAPRYVGGVKRRNLASVKSICGESRMVTIEEPCPYDPPVSVFFAGELPPPPPPKKPVRGYW